MSHNDRDGWIRGLRATRSYTERTIPAEILTRILEAGRWTGSSLNSQPWTFIVVTDPRTRRDLAAAGRFASHLAGAPVVVALAVDPDRGEFDIGRAAQNMMLVADLLGVGSCPATLHDQPRAREVLGVPSNRFLRHAIAFGYPDDDVEGTIRKNMKAVTGSARKPLAEIVRWERFA